MLRHSEMPNAPDEALSGAPRQLFRPQAIQHVSAARYGTIVLAHSFSHVFLTSLFVGLALCIVAFFTLFSTTRKAHCQGVLLPMAGIIRIVPSQSGVITQRPVVEGQYVRAGEVLFVLSSEKSGASNLAPQKAVSDLLKLRRESVSLDLRNSLLQSQHRVQAVLARADALRTENERIDMQIAMQEERVLLSEQSQQRYQDLHGKNYISKAQLQDNAGALLDQRLRLADLMRLKLAGRRDLATAEAEARDLQTQARRDVGTLQRDVSTIEQDLAENEARRETVIRAPQSGVVTAITTDVGQTVASDSALAVLLPAGSGLHAEIYVPSSAAGFVKPGMMVMLRYQAYPYQKFGQYTARVSEVAHTALRAEELAIHGVARPATPTEPLYRVRLALNSQHVQVYGKPLPLKSGMLLDASLVLEQRRLYEWVLEPLFSVAGRI